METDYAYQFDFSRFREMSVLKLIKMKINYSKKPNNKLALYEHYLCELPKSILRKTFIRITWEMLGACNLELVAISVVEGY